MLNFHCTDIMYTIDGECLPTYITSSHRRLLATQLYNHSAPTVPYTYIGTEKTILLYTFEPVRI